MWSLEFYYKEVKFVIPKDFFSVSANHPVSELNLGRETEVENAGSEITDGSSSENQAGTSSAESAAVEETTTAENNVFELSGIKKKIA